jgi:hypothetical protein
LPKLEGGMSDHVIKSMPVYAPIRLDRSGRRHLLLANDVAALSMGLAADLSPDAFDERWLVVGQSQAIPSPDERARDRPYRSDAHLLQALKWRLASETMGLRLYAIGKEAFVWSVWNVALSFGLGGREVQLCASPAGPRRVYCNHCRTINEAATTNIVVCAGCRAPLYVRDHFSRRLNAYAGVQVDAEAPGEIPPIEVLYP